MLGIMGKTSVTHPRTTDVNYFEIKYFKLR